MSFVWLGGSSTGGLWALYTDTYLFITIIYLHSRAISKYMNPAEMDFNAHKDPGPTTL